MSAAREPRILILCPLAREWSFMVKTFEASLHVKRLHDLKIEAAYIPDWRALVAHGGHGKTQFAVQAQYLIGQFPSVELVICAGAAGSLAPGLCVGDVVVGTETVEHDFRLLFATRPLPRFPGHVQSIDTLRRLAHRSRGFHVAFDVNILIDAVHLKDMLGGIQTNSDNRHGTAPWLRCTHSQPGTTDAVGGRSTPTSR